MNAHEKYFNANKELWNQRTAIHKDSAFYNLEGFKKGDSVLGSIEINDLGNVSGKSMLHLQCHFGMDSLDWQRIGAQVTGIDLSDKAIKEAKQLNSELGYSAEFICSNVYDLKDHLDHKFDIVFTSYGTIAWLPDLNRWADIVSHFLKDGGTFYIAEFHPVVWMFDDDFTHIKYYYDNREIIITENEGTYTDTDTRSAISGKEYSWNHSISEVINALTGAGLQIKSMNEYMYSPYPNFRKSKEIAPGQWQITGLEGKIPVVYSITAVKP